MPLAVYILGMSIFALGTTEFLISGLLPQIASDLAVSIPDAGLLVSGFAIGMALGAPAMAVLTLRLPKKLTLVAALALFAAGQVLGALAPGYAVLMAARILTAVATGAFWAAASVVATRLVPATARGRALAVLVGGLTVANVIGVPLGTFVGDRLGWRAAFWAVGALAVLAAAAVLAGVPRGRADARRDGVVARPDLRAELRVFAAPRIWVALAVTAVSSAAIFGTFSYLSPLLTSVAMLPSGAVPLLLALFGLGSLAGVTIGGRAADTRPFTVLYGGLGALVAVLAGLAVLEHSIAAVVVAVGLFGLFGFVINPALNVRVFTLAGDAPTLASSVSVSAFNTGNTVGPWLGGLVIGSAGLAPVPWLGAVLALLAVGVVGVAAVLERRHAARPAGAGVAVERVPV